MSVNPTRPAPTSPERVGVDDRPAPAPARQLRRDAEANRRQILEAAGRLMAERGLATPLEDIAAAAGVGIATLYRRFPTRAELIEALFQDRLAAYLADLEAAVAAPDGWEALVWYLERSSARQIADRALSELIEHDFGDETLSELRERIVPLAETVVERAKRTGRLRSDFTVSDLILVQQMVVAVGSVIVSVKKDGWRRYLTMVIDGIVESRDGATPTDHDALDLEELKQLHQAESRRVHRRL